jgi:hypothetical protein
MYWFRSEILRKATDKQTKAMDARKPMISQSAAFLSCLETRSRQQMTSHIPDHP